MADPLIAELKSLLMTEDTATAPSEGDPRQITASSVTQTTIVSADLDGANNASYVWDVFEALDGDCKGQLVLATEFSAVADTVTVTPFWKASPSGTQFRHWQYSWPKATATSSGSTTTTISTYRTEADDYWNDYYMLSLDGGNTDLKNITDFTTADDTFTHDAFGSSTAIGDCLIPVQPLQPNTVEIAIDGGVPIEREIITDSLDPEGIVIGAIEEATVKFSAELRGLAAAAGDSTTATAPAEMHVALSSAFTEVLNTGDNSTGAGSVTALQVASASGSWTAYTMGLVNGDAFGITVVTEGTPAGDTTLTVPAGHINANPANEDVVYGGACYYPKDTGWKSSSFLAFYGDGLMLALTGGMPEMKVMLNGNEIGHYDCTYHCVGGFLADLAKPYNDIYDTSTPLVGKSNVNRVVFDGSELTADVLSCELNLLDPPIKKGASFGAYENNGGHIYTGRNGGCSMVVQMEDSSYWQRYRSLDEVDLLVQVGSIATAAWSAWAPRAQLVEAPAISESDGLFQITLNLRFLRPTTQAQPAYVIGIF